MQDTRTIDLTIFSTPTFLLMGEESLTLTTDLLHIVTLEGNEMESVDLAKQTCKEILSFLDYHRAGKPGVQDLISRWENNFGPLVY